MAPSTTRKALSPTVSCKQNSAQPSHQRRELDPVMWSGGGQRVFVVPLVRALLSYYLCRFRLVYWPGARGKESHAPSTLWLRYERSGVCVPRVFKARDRPILRSVTLPAAVPAGRLFFRVYYKTQRSSVERLLRFLLWATRLSGIGEHVPRQMRPMKDSKKRSSHRTGTSSQREQASKRAQALSVSRRQSQRYERGPAAQIGRRQRNWVTAADFLTTPVSKYWMRFSPR